MLSKIADVAAQPLMLENKASPVNASVYLRQQPISLTPVSGCFIILVLLLLLEAWPLAATFVGGSWHIRYTELAEDARFPVKRMK